MLGKMQLGSLLQLVLVQVFKEAWKSLQEMSSDKAKPPLKVKRLRGWQLEMESGRKVVPKSKVLEKTQGLEQPEAPQSALANKLLHLWSSGKLSASCIREIAHLAIQDGADHPELLQLGKAGNWGESDKNSHRDIMTQFCPDVRLAEPHYIKVPCIDPKTSLEKEDWAAVFLPHLQFAHLGEYYPQFFHATFALGHGKLEKFWTGVQKLKDDRLEGHPMCLEKHWKSKVIPILVHGDGVEYQNRDSLMVWSWGCMLAEMSSLKQHMLLAAFPKSCSTKGTWEPIWKWLKWSFEALGKGFHPTHDPDGKVLEKTSKLFGKAGQALHPSAWKGHIFSIQGDHEFFSNVLKLPHWASHYPCWECDCQNFAGCDAWKSMKELDLEKSDYHVYTHDEQLADPWSDHALFQLAHVSAKNVRGDPMHILFCKGLYSHLIGGILHYACWYEGPGKVCAVRPWKRLGTLFAEIQQEYRSQGLANRLTNLKLSMFTDSAKPWASKASLDCKAGEGKHLLPALVPVLEKLFAPGMKEEEVKMISAASSLEKLVALWDEAGTFLTPAEFGKALALGKGFLLDYKWLNSWSLEKDRNSFAIVAKFHTFMHLLFNSKYMNPKKQWNFRAEDYVGHIARMGHSISFGVGATKLSGKLCSKYRVHLHFLLTRDLENVLEVNEEEED